MYPIFQRVAQYVVTIKDHFVVMRNDQLKMFDVGKLTQGI